MKKMLMAVIGIVVVALAVATYLFKVPKAPTTESFIPQPLADNSLSNMLPGGSVAYSGTLDVA
jgi:hypothetical protein